MKPLERETVVPLLAAAFTSLVWLAGCATGTGKPVPETVIVDPSNSSRVRFVVHGDPGLKKYPEILALAIPVHEKIREGMRRHAGDLLNERALCPRGFVGPELVLADENARLTRRFFVDCLQ
jgi:hypothetical protein